MRAPRARDSPTESHWRTDTRMQAQAHAKRGRASHRKHKQSNDESNAAARCDRHGRTTRDLVLTTSHMTQHLTPRTSTQRCIIDVGHDLERRETRRCAPIAIADRVASQRENTERLACYV
ncbi:hypothetical protein WMY93_020112 [Mugilogobius chulae]|uniref:Uncharacterized protein n=1 Tax=Mugilogobius chulae TaxID=88201 RepID=A0AAW0NLZ7_9GOBI